MLKRELDDVVRESSDLLPRLMQAGNLRFNLALPLTAGWDSRVLLSACKKIADNIFFYTIQNRRLQSSSADIKIPQKILKKIGFSQHLLDCRKNADESFSQLYRSNVYNAHEYYEAIAYGMLEKYPPNRVCVKGNCSEICRCFYYKSGKHPSISSVDQLIELESGWKTLHFACDQLSDWYSKASTIITDTEIDVLDLFYWEHRMGSWQSQGQLEWDIFQEAYTPFNYRELLEAMLGVSPCYRLAPNYILYRKIATNLWPEIMKYPVNPAENSVETIKNLLYRFGLAGILKQIYKRFR